jgi:hypothetical protein
VTGFRIGGIGQEAAGGIVEESRGPIVKLHFHGMGMDSGNGVEH